MRRMSSAKSKGNFDGAKCPAKVAWKKVEEEDKEEKGEEEERRNRKPVYLSLVNTLE